jgi:hypothetical protein
MSTLTKLATAARAYLLAQHVYTVVLASNPSDRAAVATAVDAIKSTEATLRAVLAEIPL